MRFQVFTTTLLLLNEARSQSCTTTTSEAHVALFTCSGDKEISYTACADCISNAWIPIPDGTSCRAIEWGLCSSFIDSCSSVCGSCFNEAQDALMCELQDVGCAGFTCPFRCDETAIELASCMRVTSMTQIELIECTSCLQDSRPENETDCDIIAEEQCKASCPSCTPCDYEVGEQTRCHYFSAGCIRFDCFGTSPPPSPAPTLVAPTPTPSPGPTLLPTEASCPLEASLMIDCLRSDITSAESQECQSCSEEIIPPGARACFELQGIGGSCERRDRCGSCGPCLDKVDDWIKCETEAKFPGCSLNCLDHSRTGIEPTGVEPSGLSTGALASIALGVLLSLVIGGVLIFFFKQKRPASDFKEKDPVTSETRESGSRNDSHVPSGVSAMSAAVAEPVATAVAPEAQEEADDGNNPNVNIHRVFRTGDGTSGPDYKGQEYEDPNEATVYVDGVDNDAAANDDADFDI